MKVILASQSPRRKELMDLLKIDYEVIVSNAEETLKEGLSNEEQSKRLGFIKAKAVFNETSGDRIVIGSDTMVLKDGKLYGKPHSNDEAIKMIKELSNSKHQVFTSVAILVQKGEEYKEYIDCDITDVYIGKMTDREIEEWVSTGEANDKAGAYAIQSKFGSFVEKIDGNYFTVVGLPINKVYKILKEYIEI